MHTNPYLSHLYTSQEPLLSALKKLRGLWERKGKKKKQSTTQPFFLQGACGKEVQGAFSIHVEIVILMEKEKLPFSLLRLSSLQ